VTVHGQTSHTWPRSSFLCSSTICPWRCGGRATHSSTLIGPIGCCHRRSPQSSTAPRGPATAWTAWARMALVTQATSGRRDFALLRQARWREALASVYDLPDLRPHLRAIRSITVEFAAPEGGDPTGLTNVVRPVYHVGLACLSVGHERRRADAEAPRRPPGCRPAPGQPRGGRRMAAGLLGPRRRLDGSGGDRLPAVRRGAWWARLTAGDRTVEVAIDDKGRERVRRTYLAPRLGEVDLLERALGR